MTALASAFVEARLDTSGFGTDIKRGMSHSSVSSSLKDSGKSAGKSYSSAFGSALKIGGLLAGAFAVTKGVSFFKDSIAEAQDAAKMSALTAQVIKTTGGAAGVTTKQVQTLATAISNKTGIDDEAIQSGENLLLTFKNVHNEAGAGNKIFDQATQAVTDMSVALGQDMKSGSIQLGKALNDPIKGITALSRVGVSFTEQQKASIKAMVDSGDTMGAQKVILKELTSEFGGAAAAAATPAEKAAVAWGNFKEDVGTALLPVLGQLATWFTETALPAVERFAGFIKSDVLPVLSSMADFVKRNSDLIAPLAVVFGTAAAAIGVVVAATKAWTAAQLLFNLVMEANPVILIITALAAVAAGLVIAYKRSETFRDIVDKAFSVVRTAFADAVRGVGWLIDAFATMVDAVLSAFGSVIDGAASAFGWIPGIGDKLKDAQAAFHDFADSTVNNLHGVADGLQNVADKVEGIPDPRINTGPALLDIGGFVAGVNRKLQGIHDEAVNVDLSARSNKVLAQLTIPGTVLAAGGPVFGAGTGTSDSILARLSNNEHVITAKEVAKAGGHHVWEALRKRALAGQLVEGYASGGAVTPQVTSSGVGSAVGKISGMFNAIASGIGAALSKKIAGVIKNMTTTGVLPGPNGRVTMDGEPLDAITAAQIVLAERLAHQNYTVMQGSFQAPSSYSGTSHTGPGVADISPGNFTTQSWMRKVGFAAWGRNFPGAHSAGSGAHVHEVSLLDPGTVNNSQVAQYRAGGDGLGGSDYGPNPPMIPGLMQQVAAIRSKMFDQGGILKPGYTLAYNGTGANEYVSKFAGGGAVQGEQRKMARIIMSMGSSMGMSDRDIKIALMTALQESGLRNLHYGDRDSQGVFQQRPSQGWGTAAQVTDPEYAAKKFFEALKGVSGREGMRMWEAAQAVQRSANGSLYKNQHDEALGIFASLKSSTTAGIGPTKGLSAAEIKQAAKDAAKAAAQAAREAAKAAREAWKAAAGELRHFRVGDNTTAATIRDESKSMTQALVGVFGKDSHIVKAVRNTSDQLADLAKERENVATRLDNASSKLARLIGERNTLENQIAGGFNTTSYGEGAPTTASGLFMSARAEINDARHFKRVLQKLKAKGLAPNILKALALAGPAAIVQAEALAGMSRKKLAEYQGLLQTGTQVEGALGDVVGNAVYSQNNDKNIADQRKRVNELNHHLGQLNHRIDKLDEKIEHAVERALRKVHIDLDGKQVNRALADHEHRRNRVGA